MAFDPDMELIGLSAGLQSQLEPVQSGEQFTGLFKATDDMAQFICNTKT
ncbi:MAG: hypothetical protein ACLR0P_03475 [Oscillospiraceae bacterium]